MRFKVIASLTLVVAALSSAAGRAQESPSLPTLKPPVAAAPKPNVFGTSNVSFVTVPEWQFTPAISSFTYSDTGGNQPMKYSNTNSNSFFIASPQLPSGALLQSLEFDYCNNQPPGGQVMTFNLYGMDYHNNVTAFLASMTGNPGDGCTIALTDISSHGYTVDNNTGRLALYVGFGTNGDATTTLQGAIIGYKLQVSPAPATATFGDVPTTDFGFQYIEALSASGITGGCGGGNYCPDNPVTRRQMAIFIAKALGLSWD